MGQPEIIFLFRRGCGLEKRARENLMTAIRQTGEPMLWREFVIGDPRTPPRYNGYPSPTVLVNGREADDGLESLAPDAPARSRPPSIKALSDALAACGFHGWL